MTITAAGSSKQSLSWHFSLFAHVYLASTMGALTVLLLPREADGAQPGSYFLLAWIFLYCVTILYVVTNGLKFRRGDMPVMAFATLGVISTAWSIQFEKTMFYEGSLCLNIVFCYLISDKYDIEKFLQMCFRVIFLLCIAGVLFKIFDIDLVRYIDVHGRLTPLGTEPIRGFFNHKITAGIYAAMALAIGFSLYRGTFRFFACGFLFLFILLTGSSASLAVFFSISFAYIFTSIAKFWKFSSGAYVSIFLLIALLIGVSVVNLLSEVLELLGRDSTLTGRALLWKWGLEAGWERPFFGWGYMGYLGTPEADAVARNIAEFRTYEVPHFHNSFVQMFVDLGIVGLILSIAIPFVSITRLYSAFLSSSARAFPAAISTILALIVAGFGVHVFYKYNDFTATYIISIFLITARYSLSREANGSALTKPENAF